MSRNESLRDQIATIVQTGHTGHTTSIETADAIIALMVPVLTSMAQRKTGAEYTEMKFRTVTEEDMLRSIRWARRTENKVSKQIKEATT